MHAELRLKAAKRCDPQAASHMVSLSHSVFGKLAKDFKIHLPLFYSRRPK